MTLNERQEIKKLWALMSAYYQNPLRDEVILMYLEDVSDLPFSAVVEAFTTYRKNPKNIRVPIPAQLRTIVSPPEDDDSMAKEAAARIIAGVSKFGRSKPGEASEYIGELGWLVVQKQGGWWSICNYLNEGSISSLQAQLRDLAVAQIKLARAGKLNTPPALPVADPKGQKKINSLVQELVEMKKFPIPKDME